MYRVENSEAIEFLRGIESGTVATVLTDPPYSSGGATRAGLSMSTRRKYQNSGVNDVKLEFLGDSRDQRSFTLWCMRWMMECYRVLKGGGFLLCFIDWRNIACVIDAGQAAGLVYRGIVPWVKTNSRPVSGMFRNQCEYCIVFTKGAYFKGEIYANGYILHAVIPTSKRIHSTEKPVDVLRHLLTFTPDGGLVIDPFSGSGSVAEACAQLGLRFMGCELSPELCAMANDRLARLDDTGRQERMEVWA